MSVNKYNSTTGNLERLDGYTVDSTPTSGSGNPVSSGGVYSALAGKADSGSIIKISYLNDNQGDCNNFNIFTLVCGRGMANQPINDGSYYTILTLSTVNGADDNYKMQFGFSIYGGVYQRIIFNGNWSAWRQLYTNIQ